MAVTTTKYSAHVLVSLILKFTEFWSFFPFLEIFHQILENCSFPEFDRYSTCFCSLDRFSSVQIATVHVFQIFQKSSEFQYGIRAELGLWEGFESDIHEKQEIKDWSNLGREGCKFYEIPEFVNQEISLELIFKGLIIEGIVQLLFLFFILWNLWKEKGGIAKKKKLRAEKDGFIIFSQISSFHRIELWRLG